MSFPFILSGYFPDEDGHDPVNEGESLFPYIAKIGGSGMRTENISTLLFFTALILKCISLMFGCGNNKGIIQTELSSENFSYVLKDLPGEWIRTEEYFSGNTRLGTVPPVTDGSGRVLFAAVDEESSASALVLFLPDIIRADDGLRDSLAVALPSALSVGWGFPFRTVWADTGSVKGAYVIRAQGVFETDYGDKSVLITWIPASNGHFTVFALTGTGDTPLLLTISSKIAAVIAGDKLVYMPGKMNSSIMAGLLVLLGFTALLFLGRRR